MATYFEDTASDFGVASPKDDYNEDIYAPVQLSNTTRRVMKPEPDVNSAQGRVNYYSLPARLEREKDQEYRKIESELMQLDKMHDEAYERKIDQRVKAAAWNDKVKAQEHGAAVADALTALDPTDPGYLTKVDELTTKYPLASYDNRIKSVLESKKALYDTTKEARDKDEQLRIKQEDRMAAREDNQAFQLDSARISREENLRNNIELKVADMSDEGQKGYEQMLAEGKSPMEAFRAARLQDRGVVSIKEANMANRMVQGYNRQIATAQAALNKINSNLGISDEEKEAQGMEYKSQMEDLAKARDLEMAVLDAYWESKGGRPQPKQEYKAPAPKKPSTMSVKSLLPTTK